MYPLIYVSAIQLSNLQAKPNPRAAKRHVCFLVYMHRHRLCYLNEIRCSDSLGDVEVSRALAMPPSVVEI